MNLNAIHSALFELSPGELSTMQTIIGKILKLRHEICGLPSSDKANDGELLCSNFIQNHQSAEEFVDCHHGKTQSSAPPMKHHTDRSQNLRPVAQELRARNPRLPLRPPKPGSLRQTIYQILGQKNGMPLSRAEIIAQAAAVRNCKPNDNFKASVGEILRCKTDPRIRRVAHGMYRIVPTS
jgi:hypothetical protein